MLPLLCAPTTGTPGSHILSLPQLASCSLANDYVIPAYRDCASWKTSTVTLQLALEVAGDCSITIRPISDKSCADPGANKTTLALFPRTASQNGMDANEKYTYTYNDLLIRAYYTSTTTIRTLLPSTDGGARWAYAYGLAPFFRLTRLDVFAFISADYFSSSFSMCPPAAPLCSSFMLNIDKSDTKVELKFWAATNKPEATLPAVSWKGLVMPSGGGLQLRWGCGLDCSSLLCHHEEHSCGRANADCLWLLPALC